MLPTPSTTVNTASNVRHILPLLILAVLTACADPSGPTPVLKESAYVPTSSAAPTATISYTAPLTPLPADLAK
jgi:hypothetical protein